MVAANSLNISETGFQSFDGVSVFKGRTLQAGTGISISNGTGVSGNPTVSSSLNFPLDPSLGGTGANNVATSGTLLRGNGTDFVPTTATYPNTAGTSGNVLTSDGTNWNSAAPISSAGTLNTLNFTLTNSQIKNIHGTPIQLLAAPGAGKTYVIVQSLAKLIYGGTNAFVAGGSARLTLYGGTTYFASELMLNGTLVATGNRYESNSGLQGTGSVDGANLALNIYNPSATEISGNAANNNTISGSIAYYIATL
jgi:hypothetical protein